MATQSGSAGPKTSAAQFGNDSAKKLGLPSIDVDALPQLISKDTANAYLLTCQAILHRRSKGDKPFTPFVDSRLLKMLGLLRTAIGSAAPSHGLLNAQEAQAWLTVLGSWPALLNLSKTNSEEIANRLAEAPAILRFWIELGKVQDLENYANSDKAIELKFADLEKPLQCLPGCNEAVLILCRKGKEKSVVPVVGVWLEADEKSGLSPKDGAQLIINPDEFFIRDSSEPLGGIDPDALKRWIEMKAPEEADGDRELEDPNSASRGNPPEASPKKPSDSTIHSAVEPREDWPSFFQRWQSLTNQYLGATKGLADLCTVLRGPSSSAFQIRIVDAKDVLRGGHTDLLFEAAQDSNKYPLIYKVLEQLSNASKPKPVSIASLDRSQFLGHMDTCKDGDRRRAFPLDPTQRLAAMAVASLPFEENTELLPINGPPGTGKTSFLRAALASMWVRSALDKAKHPPVVYGVAATNQAVSNMIEAFGTIRSTRADGPGFPWLGGLSSYGWFFPSKDAAAARPDLMQLRWSDSTKSPFTPAGQAADFSEMTREALSDELLSKAAVALGLSGSELNVESVCEKVHDRLQALHRELKEAQETGQKVLRAAPCWWKQARGQSWVVRSLGEQLCQHEALNDRFQGQLGSLRAALGAINLQIVQEQKLETGWRSLLPSVLRQWLWRRDLSDLAALRKRSGEAFATLGTKMSAGSSEPIDLPTDLPSLMELVKKLGKAREGLEVEQADLGKRIESLRSNLADAQMKVEGRRKAVAELFKVTGQAIEGTSPSPANRDLLKQRRSLLRLLRDWVKSGQSEEHPTYEHLVHGLEAPLDPGLRVEMFHWAARYWECRWLLSEPGQGREGQIERLMMLGVIIVATTHKVIALGKKRPADLLIMDEAGQCSPEVAAACLALAKRAVFVGDVLQLQPVTSIGADLEQAIEQGVSPDATIPDVVKPLSGSGMWLARAAAIRTSGGEPGVTLLHHYRCMPEIIGYCNELLYKGRIQNARKEPRMPHLSWIPCMSWVAVQGTPQRESGSWVNAQEVQEIVRWLVSNQERLTTIKNQKGDDQHLALSDVVAIVTPLSKQAAAIRKALTDTFGESAVGKMVIGTVHKLQGAERPVVLFSLVQARPTNKTLMADRDGGMLMNVAVSRARDAFVIFGDRKTLLPAPADVRFDQLRPSSEPIAKLGRYLRKEGSRLYPNTLVVVEAPGKCKAIGQALGMDVAVLATGGNLRESALSDVGLTWSASPKKWLDALTEHAGLIRELVIATDDDLAGELIGMHAAEDAVSLLAGGVNGASPLRVRRMRFSDITPKTLRNAFAAAGGKFDSQLLAAALVRQFANSVDRHRFEASGLPMTDYASAQVRDAVNWIDQAMGEFAASPSKATMHVWCEIKTQSGKNLTGFVVDSSSALSVPAEMTRREADRVMVELKTSPALTPLTKRSVSQRPGLYPANTTARILALCVDELRLNPSDAQSHLNALYLQGADIEKESRNG